MIADEKRRKEKRVSVFQGATRIKRAIGAEQSESAN
jgi:hypothetical protein